MGLSGAMYNGGVGEGVGSKMVCNREYVWRRQWGRVESDILVQLVEIYQLEEKSEYIFALCDLKA